MLTVEGLTRSAKLPMASKHGVKSKRFFGSSGAKGAANSPSSSTTSSSKQFQETSVDGPSSPASSSVRSKPQRQFYPETAPLDAQRGKENVTVTVRFRPLK